LKKPVEKKFPDNRLRDISSDPLDTDKPWVKGELPKDSFAARWVAPAKWDAATPGVKKVQWPGFTNKDREWESKDQRAERLKRQAAVKRGFAYAWQKYKDAAWGEYMCAMPWDIWRVSWAFPRSLNVTVTNLQATTKLSPFLERLRTPSAGEYRRSIVW